MADRNTDNFDPTRKLALTRGVQLNGHQLGRHAALTIVDDPAKPGEITDEDARRLFGGGTVGYADELLATPVEDKRSGVAALVVVDQLGGGWFQIRAPWLDAPLKVQGQAAATNATLAAIDEGMGQISLTQAPAATGYSIVRVAGGDLFEVNGPGLAEPFRIEGEAAALAKRDELARGATTAPTGAGGNQIAPPGLDPATGGDGETDDESEAGQEGGTSEADDGA